MDRQTINDMSSRLPERKLGLLTFSKEDAVPGKGEDTNGSLTKLPVATLLELALKILEPDIKLRGLQMIGLEQIMYMIEQIALSLYEKGELGPFQHCYQSEHFIPYLYKTITGLRRAGADPQAVSYEWGEKFLGKRVLGRILNEYELGLEAWAYLDESAIFSQAAGIVEAGNARAPERIIVSIDKSELEPVASRFLDALMLRAELLWLDDNCQPVDGNRAMAKGD